MRKMKPLPNGSGAKRKAYYLEEAMQFCLPFIKTSVPPSPANLLSVVINSADGSDETLQDNSSDADFSLSAQPQTSQVLTQDTPHTQCLSFRAKTKTTENRSAAESDRSLAEYFKVKKAKMSANETETAYRKIDKQESLKMFLLSLLPELEELNDSQIKAFKRRVFSVIDDISTPVSNTSNTNR